MSNTLSERLILARELRGLDQHQLAERSGVSHATIAGLERGGRGCQLRTLSALVRGLEIERAGALAWIAFGIGDPPRLGKLRGAS